MYRVPQVYVPDSSDASPQKKPSASTNDDDDNFWVCSSCQWVNKVSDDTRCKACGHNAPPTVLPKKGAVPGKGEVHKESSVAPMRPSPHAISNDDDGVGSLSSNQLWICTKCSWVNKNTEPKCDACNNPAPPGTAIVTVQQESMPPSLLGTPATVETSTPPTAATLQPQQIHYGGYAGLDANAANQHPQSPMAAPPPPKKPQPLHPPPKKAQHTAKPLHAQQQKPTNNSTPRRFQIKEKMFGFGDNFKIKDEQGKAVYIVKGQVFSIGDQLSFQDASSGKELAMISQEVFSFQPRFQIKTRNNKVLATITKDFTFFEKNFTIDIPNSGQWKIKGSPWEHNFSFRRGKNIVATVSKTYFSWTDTYGVEVAAGEDAVLVLCACIVIDQILHDDRR